MPVIVKSGLHVVGDFEIASGAITIGEVLTNISGQPVTISGDHVVVGSGLNVVGDFSTEVASGLHVVVESGIGVIGDFNAEVASGLFVDGISGVHVLIDPIGSSGLNVIGEVASGLHVVVESGIGVIGDFTAEVSSGLYVVQGKTAQLQNYFISDIDESDTGIKFYGYLDGDGSWYIMQDTSGTNFRYASSGIYASNWIDRSGIIYQRFDQEF